MPSVALTTPSTVGKWTLRSLTDRKGDTFAESYLLGVARQPTRTRGSIRA